MPREKTDVQAERTRCYQIVQRLNYGYVSRDSIENALRLIRGIEHAVWCQTKYNDPCNCGIAMFPVEEE